MSICYRLLEKDVSHWSYKLGPSEHHSRDNIQVEDKLSVERKKKSLGDQGTLYQREPRLSPSSPALERGVFFGSISMVSFDATIAMEL